MPYRVRYAGDSSFTIQVVDTNGKKHGVLTITPGNVHEAVSYLPAHATKGGPSEKTKTLHKLVEWLCL